MTALQITYMALGFLCYWIVKVPAVIKGQNATHNVKEFFRDNLREIVLSVIGLVLFVLAGPAYPEYVNLTSPVTIFISGGAVPSIFNNLIAALSKSKQ